MKKLTNKEREIMDLYWQHGPMFVRENHGSLLATWAYVRTRAAGTLC